MTRGNQRDIDRERARKRAERAGADRTKKKDDKNGAQSLQNKKQADAEIMRKKQEDALKKKEAESSGEAGSSK
eukprot:CAMPEP_0184700058 /NCGR_PEP_ID=MMETSP0313-20130426/7854_1 /TAXON_ID=2792 /ORGANISM="Porphyridium aerugineum, Strain SAG 1380-2" /LENGTH=72 /DNA_ID=CAMNT_0027159429 /DNA_START=145 /DNA_END=363 /DNA_ORIENTATION=+